MSGSILDSKSRNKGIFRPRVICQVESQFGKIEIRTRWSWKTIIVLEYQRTSSHEKIRRINLVILIYSKKIIWEDSWW